MTDYGYTIITGASSGIGAEIARLAAADRRNLLLIARREDRLTSLREELARKHGVTVRVLPLDLTTPTAPMEVLQYADGAGLDVDCLVNNAAFGGHGLFHEQPLDRNLEMVQLNVSSSMALTRLLLPSMIERGRRTNLKCGFQCRTGARPAAGCLLRHKSVSRLLRAGDCRRAARYGRDRHYTVPRSSEN